MRDQKGWTEHAEFMDALEAEHFFVLGGPLRNYSKHRAMLIVNAPNEQELRRRLEAGPGCARVCYELSTSILGRFSWENCHKQARNAAGQTVQLKQFEGNTSNNDQYIS